DVGKFILSVADDEDREELPIAPRGFDIIGKLPYDLTKRLAFGFPKTVSANCTFCGTCAKVCPTEAITLDRFRIDTERCIGCGACVKACPKGAKSINRYPWTKAILRKGFAEVKYPEEITGQK
ncbi:MAG: 4Fe-4S binding protein, partial [Clostridia bacterium]|nr:4Fe-4S binding protein [Clostridia bacterium]